LIKQTRIEPVTPEAANIASPGEQFTELTPKAVVKLRRTHAVFPPGD